MALTEPQSFRSRTGSEFVVRCPERKDAANLIQHALATMQESSFNVTEPDEFKVTLQQEEESISKTNAASKDLCLVAEMNGRLVGSLNFYGRRQRRVGHVGSF